MVSAHSSLLYYFSILSLFPSISSISIPLSHPETTQHTFKTPYQKLNHLVTTSLTRAHHLKNPKPKPPTTTTTTTPVYPHNYGAYSIPLSFGTPPQTFSFIMDTGSNLVWFPCTSHYLCKNCSESSPVPSFLPKHSSSSKIIGCTNPKCSWIHSTTPSKCQDLICPPYLIIYGSGTTGGIALSETLHLPGLISTNFLVGCSVFSSHLPPGIAGFGRGLASLPSQLKLNKFSYCSPSYKSINNHSSLLLLDYSRTGSDMKTRKMVYTQLVKNPKMEDKPAFLVYYYVGLRRISLGGRRVRIPYKYLFVSEKDGNGGTIVDSGTTLTYMSGRAFGLLSDELVFQMEEKGFKRNVGVENLSGLRPCFDVSNHVVEKESFPELKFYFKGGVELVLPVENYLAFVGNEQREVCLMIVTDEVEEEEEEEEVGPGIILGNFQLQNFNLEFDLENERIGFKQQEC